MEKYILESKNERLARRISKFLRDWEHFQYLLKKGYHPLEISDSLTHNMFQSIRIGLQNKYPKASQQEIHKKMKKMVEYEHNLKKLRRTSIGRN